MKLAIVTPYPPSKTTLNEYAYHLVKHFDQNEDISEIILMTDELPAGESYQLEDSLNKVKINVCWKFNGWSNIRRIAKAIKETKPDVVLYNLQFLSFGDAKIPATLGLLSPYWSKITGTPSTVLLHNIIETVDLDKAGITGNKLLTKFFMFAGTITTKLILNANKVALTIPKYVDIIEAKYKAKNVVHMPHGTFEIPEEPTYSHGPQETMKVMTFGKFGTYKKVEMMIEAVEKIRQRVNKKIEIVIAGTDNPNVPGYLDNVAKKYSHVPDMTFTGYVAEEDVPRIFKESTAVVFPYNSTTGSSGVLHQAGSYGKATVLPLLGDLKELTEEEGYGGAYFKYDDVDDMAAAIEKILVDDEFRVAIEQQNFKAASMLSMSEIAKRYVDLFKAQIGQKTKKGAMAIA